MKRREFLAAAAIAGAIPAAARAEKQPSTEKIQEIIEITKYQLFTGVKKQLVSDFYRDAAIPALNRIGIDRVGVFTVMYGPTAPTLYVIMPHRNLDAFMSYQNLLLNDKEYTKAGADFLNAPFDDPAYVRMETSLLKAFKYMPLIETPKSLLDNKGRIYEMRIYESHSRKFAQKKIEMFNEGGELGIFRATSLTPVFFGETIAGPIMPNLTYMLAFNNIEERNARWGDFVSHPDWVKLREDAQYKDTVSNITDIILRPEPFSQI